MPAPSDPFPSFETLPLPVTRNGATIELKLRHAKAAKAGSPAVLMLHGGNSSSLTYTAPDGGLAQYLRKKGIDVWLLDWRASPLVVDPLLEGQPLNGSVAAEREFFNLDLAVSEDVPHALARIRARIGAEAPLSIMGHCLGGAVVAMAVARAELEPYRVGSVILLTLGLFVEVPWNGWIKAEDFILERILNKDPECRGIDPRAVPNWPKDMAEAYQGWPATWLPKGPEFLRALAFMIGLPYTPERVAKEFRTPGVANYFGTMHLGIYLHSGQLVRRGFCGPLNAPDVIDRSRLQQQNPSRDTQSDLRPGPFRSKHITLIAASENRIWHRDSIDLMYEWLRNNGCSSANAVKHVLPGYNLQELLWGVRAREQVYPKIEKAVRAAVHGVAQNAAE
jgi:pimeloyl-ACP methyl ester carboxylesterase